MILFAALGYAGLHFLGMPLLFPAGIVSGLIAAQFVPAKACAIKSPPEEAA